MAEFLITTGINHKLEQIIINSNKSLLFISPYIKISEMLLQRLKEKAEDGVEINFVYGKKRYQEDVNKLKQLPNINIYYLENLHAKLYSNEYDMILTSLNLYEFSQVQNREMGIYFNSDNDPRLFEDALSEAKSILKISELTFKSTREHNMQESKTSITESINNIKTYSNIKIVNLLKKLLSDKYKRNDIEIYTTKAKKHLFLHYFKGDYFSLEVHPYENSFRIIFQTESKIESKESIYNLINATQRTLIENYFPKGFVNWGNQMYRIKIDGHICDYNINNEDSVFSTDETYANYLMKLIAIGEEVIVDQFMSYHALPIKNQTDSDK